MKPIKFLFILILLLFLLEVNSFAKDTDIYVLDQSIEQILPDALIILDISYRTIGSYDCVKIEHGCNYNR